VTERTPLSNVRVLDAASFMAAPMAAMWLGDFGADVIKIEHPKGDMMRTWGSSKNDILEDGRQEQEVDHARPP
jgi:crotonobetainyl-CoA:carnitine CoA-transferase CaiB-like acyl-CoA transferase